MSSNGSADDDKEGSAKESFTLSALFGATNAAKSKAATALRGAAAATAEHPSVRDHVSPLNLLYPGGGLDDPGSTFLLGITKAGSEYEKPLKGYIQRITVLRWVEE